MQDALNGQINAEMYSAYLYLAMNAYFQSINFNGFAQWMRVQYQEEMIHAMKIYDFIAERGGRIVLDAIDKPQGDDYRRLYRTDPWHGDQKEKVPASRPLRPIE